MVVLMPLVHRTCLFSKAEVKCEEVASVWAVFATTSAAKLWCLPRTGAFCEHVAPPGPGYCLDSAKRPVLNRKRGVWQNLVANQGLPHATGDNSRQSSLRTPLPRPWKTTMVASKVSSSSYPPQDTCTKATEDNERATQGEVSSEATKHRNQKPSPGGVSRSIADTDGAGGRPTRPQAKNIRPNAPRVTIQSATVGGSGPAREADRVATDNLGGHRLHEANSVHPMSARGCVPGFSRKPPLLPKHDT